MQGQFGKINYENYILILDTTTMPHLVRAASTSDDDACSMKNILLWNPFRHLVKTNNKLVHMKFVVFLYYSKCTKEKGELLRYFSLLGLNTERL